MLLLAENQLLLLFYWLEFDKNKQINIQEDCEKCRKAQRSE